MATQKKPAKPIQYEDMYVFHIVMTIDMLTLMGFKIWAF